MVVLYSVHPKPVLTPFVAIIAVFTSSNFAAVLTALFRLASHTRPSAVHFVVQLSPIASVFTQLTSETQGGVDVPIKVNPLPQTQAEALVAPPAPDAADEEPHDLHTGFAAALL